MLVEWRASLVLEKNISAMKNLVLSIFILISVGLLAQSPVGTWEGALTVQGQSLKILFHVSETNGVFSSLMDSPDQGAIGIPTTETLFKNNVLVVKIANAGIEYTGEMSGDMMKGIFKQGSANIPLDLNRRSLNSNNARPQTPVPPFPYRTDDVIFENTKAGIQLAGTLTIPKGQGVFPVVVLISGSGPQNRDEELMGHKHFHVIADYFARNGVATLRYDDRGVAQSQGDFQSATSRDFADDVNAALDYLKSRKEVDQTSIGLAGHSEGGLIAPMVAAERNDVAFIIMLAGTGIRGDLLLLKQQELIAAASGMSKEEIQTAVATNRRAFDVVMNTKDEKKMAREVTDIISEAVKNITDEELPSGMTKEKFIEAQVAQLTSPWIRYFLSYDPAVSLSKVHCPVFALNGAMDLQVPADDNLNAIAECLKKADNVRVITKKYPSMNHLFQTCVTGSPDEYPNIPETISPVVLEDMLSWIKSDK